MKIAAIDPGIKNLAIVKYVNDNSSIKYNLFLIDLKSTASQIQLITKLFDELDKLNLHSYTILIETQLRHNYNTNLIVHACMSYCILKNIHLIPVPSTLKSKHFGIPPKLSYPDRKKTGIEIAKMVLSESGNASTITELEKYKKQDDLCDCVLMIHIFSEKV